MRFPALVINVESIRHNARVISGLLERRGMRFVGVAKGTVCHPDVVRAMLSGGAAAVGDSRIGNLMNLRAQGYEGETVLLRAPSPSSCKMAAEVADISLNSEVETVRLLGAAAIAAGKEHRVILMVDMGDLREGVLPADAPGVALQMASVPGIRLVGVGTNWGCFGGVVPSPKSLGALVALKEETEGNLGFPLDIVSGGNSTAMKLVLDDTMPWGVTELRIGESVLLGLDAAERRPVPGCRQDAFTLRAEVIEVLRKPSAPLGPTGQDAFGEIPEFVDKGIRRRAICAIGRQDIDPEGLIPLISGISVQGASSDHLILDVEEVDTGIQVGQVLDFRPNYSALLRASTSPFVRKEVLQ